MKKFSSVILMIFAGMFVRCDIPAANRFESLALVDNFDFANVSDPSGKILFDTETQEGTRKILDHVLETGATTILWRNCAGAIMRYQSAEENHPYIESPLDKRRIPSSRPVYGWLRYDQADPDIFRSAMEICHQKKVGAGVHWPYEETHWMSWTLGAWNLEHPQFWCVTSNGKVWPGRCSISFREVREHKLRLLDELLDRGISDIFIDSARAGGWSPQYEYVQPMVDLWKKRYGTPPPRNHKDPEWCKLVSEQFQSYLQAIKMRIGASGRDVRLLLGVSWIDGENKDVDSLLLARGIDWKRLVEEKVIDGIVLQSVMWDSKDPYGSTRQIYRNVIAFCTGKCQVFFPVSIYNFDPRKGLPSYQKETGAPLSRIVEELIRIAWEEGGDGFVMECVDYNNYPPQVREKMRDLLNGPYRFKKVHD